MSFNVGDKIDYVWADDKKGTTFVASSLIMPDDGKNRPFKHTLCNGAVVIQNTRGDNRDRWWASLLKFNASKVPFVPKGVDKPAKAKAEPKAKAKPTNDIIAPKANFLHTKNKEPTNVWISKARYDELLKCEADFKAMLIDALQYHDKKESEGKRVCHNCSEFKPESEMFGCEKECSRDFCSDCLYDNNGTCPDCAKKAEEGSDVEVDGTSNSSGETSASEDESVASGEEATSGDEEDEEDNKDAELY
jgi:hypothetical protein